MGLWELITGGHLDEKTAAEQQAEAHGGYGDVESAVDYSNGHDVASWLAYSQETQKGPVYQAEMPAGSRWPHKRHQVVVEHTGIKNMGDIDVETLAGQYEVRNPQAFADGFEASVEYHSKPSFLRRLLG